MTDQIAQTESAPSTDAAIAAPIADTPTTTEVATTATTGENATTESAAIADPVEVDAPTAPEKYEFQAPEGSALSPDVLSEFEVTARELNLSQDAAQTLISKMAPAMQKAQQAEVARLRTEWAEASKVDKEFGGEKFAENLAISSKAVNTFGDQELKDILEQTGLGNHPAFIRAFYKAGKQISPSAFVAGGLSTSANDQTPTAKRLYPDMK